MTGIEIQELLENVRMRLLEAIAPLPDEALLARGAVGDWSIQEFLFLLTAWDAELVTGLMKIKQGKAPQRLLEALAERDAYQLVQLSAAPQRSLDQIFDDLQRVRVELEEWIAQFSNRDLNAPDRVPQLKKRSLYTLIAETSYDYELSFLPAVESYASNWMNPPQVPLSTIKVTD